MIAPAPLTPEERRALSIGVLTAACTALATGLVTWALDEAKRVVADRREARKPKPEVSPCES